MASAALGEVHRMDNIGFIAKCFLSTA